MKTQAPMSSLGWAYQWEAIRTEYLLKHGRTEEAEQARIWRDFYRGKIEMSGVVLEDAA